jgi:energy-coupling factor transport system permease protein
MGEGARLMPIYLYIDRGTFVHRLHPTVKVFSLFVMFWSVYWVDNPIALLVPIGVIMLWIAQLTDSWPNFYRLRYLFVILIFTTTIMWMIFYQRGTPLFKLELFRFGSHHVAIDVTWLSIKFGVGRGIKLAELLAASVLFLSTTKIEEFTYGLQRMRVPYRVGFAISLSFRLVPLFIDSAVTIVDAQRLRGYDFNQGGPLERVRRYVPVVIPVFMGALRKANNMAMALEARGFGFSHEPTTFIEYPVTPADVAAFIFLLILGALYFILYYTGLGGIGPVK